jgi:hypothetical protein
MRMRCIKLPPVAYAGSKILFHINGTILDKMPVGYKMLILIFSTPFCGT